MSDAMGVADRRVYVGSWDQLFGVRALQLDDGPERGVRLLDVDTGGGLRFDVLVDRGFDIGRCTYRGMSLAWLSPTGHAHPHRYERTGDDWLRGFGGGMMTTCGLQAVGAPSEDAGRSWGLHGDVSFQAASSVQYDVDPAAGRIALRATVRDASSLGPVLILERTIEAAIGGSSVAITDRLRNDGAAPSEYAMLYHVNLGHPFLSEMTEIEFPADDEVEPFDDVARRARGEHRRGARPDAAAEPEIFLHRTRGPGRVVITNPATPVGSLRMTIEYPVEELPLLWQWRFLRDRIYVMGIEPATATVAGRAASREAGLQRTLLPGAEVTQTLTIRVENLNP
jgi:hypothetical protein